MALTGEVGKHVDQKGRLGKGAPAPTHKPVGISQRTFR